MVHSDASALIDQMKARLLDPLRATEGAHIIAPKVFPPATSDDILVTERELGFELPPLLRRIYLEIGNGGFGPGYGLLGVAGGTTDYPFTMATLYKRYCEFDQDDQAWSWPIGLLPICHLGCGMYACVDCNDQNGPMTWFEPNPRERGEPTNIFLIPLTQTLEAWLWDWLQNKDLLFEAYERSDLKQWRLRQNAGQS